MTRTITNRISVVAKPDPAVIPVVAMTALDMTLPTLMTRLSW